jgi:hypothetical protein
MVGAGPFVSLGKAAAGMAPIIGSQAQYVKLIETSYFYLGFMSYIIY